MFLLAALLKWGNIAEFTIIYRGTSKRCQFTVELTSAATGISASTLPMQSGVTSEHNIRVTVNPLF